MEWEAVIGLEVHVQLSTESKIFSGSATTYGAAPNTQASAIDLGLPGVLPTLNEKAVDYAITFGLAVNATISPETIFARKNYFYPDLPKGYQISQLDQPIVSGGYIDIVLANGENKRITLTRAHLEEDAGKSLHEQFTGYTGIDLNRAGTPLLEIVSDPVMRSPDEAVTYLKTLHSLVRTLGICDGNLQEGSFRCDANVSVRPKGDEKLGTRTELKNINSFRYVDKAIRYEIERQINIIEDGGKVNQETRLYDPVKNITRAMRSKEEAMDYRYFPDPDLPPLTITEAHINKIKATLPELPREKQLRYIENYALSTEDAAMLANDKDAAAYFENCLALTTAQPKIVANWIIGDLSAYLNKFNKSLNEQPITAARLAALLNRIVDNTLSGKTAKLVFDALWEQDQDVDAIIAAKGLQQVTDDNAINEMVLTVLSSHPEQVQQFRDGNEKVFGFLVGKVMQACQGKANPQKLNQILREKLTHE